MINGAVVLLDLETIGLFLFLSSIYSISYLFLEDNKVVKQYS